MKDVFLVDADDTLLDFHGSSAIALYEAFVQSDLPFQEGYFTEFERINNRFWTALEKKELTRKELMERRFPVFLRKIGLDWVDAEKFNHRYLEHLSTHPVYIEGAEAFLKALKERGRIYIVTNGNAHIQKSRFTLCGLYDYAEEIFISQEVGYDKPAKEYTAYITANIPDFSLERAVWIGDSAHADIKAANEGKITSVWFNRKDKAAPLDVSPDYTAKNFDEVLAILDKIN